MNERRQLDLPDRRRNTYDELVKRLDDHTVAVERRLHRFFAKALAIFAIIGITSAVALLGFGIVLDKFKDTRADYVRDSCRAQNERNKDTIKAFHEEANRLKKQFPEQAAGIDAGVRSNLRLINTLQPRQDCDRLAKVSVGEADPPPPLPPVEP